MMHTRRVEKGDTITFSVWSLLTNGFVPYPTAAAPVLLGTLGALGTQRPQQQPLQPTEAGQPKPSTASRLLSQLTVGLGFTLGRAHGGRAAKPGPSYYPSTWIKYRVLDEQGQEVAQGTVYAPYPDAAHLNPEWNQLKLGVRVRQGGSIELSAGTAETSGYTYFDDFAIEQTGSLIVQEQHQYAYGAPLPGLSYTVGNKNYRHGYQGQFAERDQETGWDSFEARTYDARIGRWLSPDPIRRIDSPYTGMGNNPIAFGDADGRDIIVLNYTNGASGAGHMALLVGNEKAGWDLYSKNGTSWFFGYSGPAPLNGHMANQRGEHYSTLEQFYEANSKFGEEAPQYDRAVRIETTTIEDEAARKRAKEVLGVTYHLFNSSCQSMVQAALEPLHIGFWSGSGAEGSITPNANFTDLRMRLERLEDPVFSKSFWAVGLGQAHRFTDITPNLRAGIRTALRAHNIKVKNPKFR
jgi:RHS repeat-associated protein